ncbi:MAG: M28 family peptidase [Vicinamibacterales bacterium]
MRQLHNRHRRRRQAAIQDLTPWLLVVCLAGCVRTEGQARPAALPPPGAMPASLAAPVDRAIDAMWTSFDAAAAQGHVDVIGPTWRLAGNAAFDAALDRVHDRLASSGFDATHLRFEAYDGGGHGWSHEVGTLAIVRDGAPDEVVLSRDTHRVALAINSFSTPAGGTVARLVDVGRGTRPEDFANVDLKGAVVLGDGSIGQLWRRAVGEGGAIGVVSTQLGDYVNPDPPGTATPTPRDEWDILQWGSVPYDDTHRGFGFKASPRAAATIRRAMAAAGPDGVRVRVTAETSFSEKPARMLIAEIPGTTAPDERIVVAAHVQEPGAGDNASGVATLVETVRALDQSIREGRVPAPARTITFLWLEEISGSREWIRAHPDEAAATKYMFSLDMTGEDVTKTGGSFLVERYPDPAAVWDRPWDPHSEWGRGNVRAASLRGDLINDLHLSVLERVASKSGWAVSTNPYEGGSDHTVFGSAGVPSLLDWHFTDRYYHTSMDTPDKTSGAEMRNVGTGVAASAWVLASADAAMARDVATLVAEAGRARIDLETREGAKLAATEKDETAAEAREQEILAAWRQWYAEAVQSASRLVVGPATADFAAAVQQLAAPFQSPSGS